MEFERFGCGQIAAFLIGAVAVLIGLILAVGFWPVALVIIGAGLIGMALKQNA